jgi:copper(I)-binding protein
MRNLQKLWFFSSIAIALIIGLPAAQSDTPFEAGSNIRVEGAAATVAREGETSRIRFRIVNDSPATFHVLGIDTSVARGARLVADIGKAERTALESIGVPPGETLDLTTSHLWYEIGLVTRDLHTGETFDIALRFVGGKLAVPVHVHDTPSGR